MPWHWLMPSTENLMKRLRQTSHDGFDFFFALVGVGLVFLISFAIFLITWAVAQDISLTLVHLLESCPTCLDG